MNILKAVSWACRAWYNDVDPQNLRNRSTRFGWLEIPTGEQAQEDEEEYKATKRHVRDIVEKLEQVDFLHKAMEIDTFINPPFESSEGAWTEEEKMETQARFIEFPEGDSNEEMV
ncbi:hypothetical protein N7522_006852 [Penicillium canescens]|nr:hypothetical protein N7522_006852 [Penicillium canescens]